MNKYDHVRNAQQTRKHHCHWPGCELEVPPAMWGCRKHWFMLPKPIRNRIWKTYRPGQENDAKVSPQYVEAAEDARRWALEHGQ